MQAPVHPRLLTAPLTLEYNSSGSLTLTNRGVGECHDSAFREN
jgi:hypothetical protein